MAMTTAINVAITPLSEANMLFFQPRPHPPHMITCIAKMTFAENINPWKIPTENMKVVLLNEKKRTPTQARVEKRFTRDLQAIYQREISG